jgi:uncharacterized coiled-coil protein SlyX
VGRGILKRAAAGSDAGGGFRGQKMTEQTERYILKTLENLMATVADLQTDVAKLQTDVASMVTALGTVQTTNASLQTKITALQAQIAAGSPVTQDQLDALDASVKSIDGTVVAALPVTPTP